MASIPAKHTTGRYYAPDPVLDELEANDQIVFRYAAGENFNGSSRDIAGVSNKAGNVVGRQRRLRQTDRPQQEGSLDRLGVFGLEQCAQGDGVAPEIGIAGLAPDDAGECVARNAESLQQKRGVELEIGLQRTVRLARCQHG